MDDHRKRTAEVVRLMFSLDPDAAAYLTPEKLERMAAVMRKRPAREPLNTEWSQSARIQSLANCGRHVPVPHEP